MVPGFKKRLLQEIKHQIQTYDEFEGLRSILKYIRIPENIYAPNIAAWVGASILMSLGQDADRFLLTVEEYNDNESKIPDRFGEAFLTLDREGNYFNKNFEINLARQKQALYANNSPFSARSLQSKTESIASSLHHRFGTGASAMGITPVGRAAQMEITTPKYLK